MSDSLLNFLCFFIKRYLFSFIFFFIAPNFIILETNIIPYAFKMIIDTLVSEITNKEDIFINLYPALLLFIVARILFIIIIRFLRWWEAIIIPNFEADIRLFVLNYVMKHPCYYFSSELVGNIVSKIVDLPQAIEQIRTIVCWNIIPSFAVVICTLVMALSINPLFSLIIGLWVITHISMSIYFSSIINKLAQHNTKIKWHLNGTMLDIFSNIVTVKVFDRYLHELNYVSYIQRCEKKSNSHLMKTANYFQIIMDIPLTVMLGCILYFLIVNWKQEVITTGECIFIINTAFSVMHQLWSVSQIFTNLSRQLGIAQKAFDVASNLKEVNNNRKHLSLQVTKGEIEFKNVSFCYPNGKQIFNNFNLKIKAKQKVGIVGLSGSGKSTFLNLILQLIDVNSGIITIDGQDIQKVNRSSLYKNISVVPADTQLFCRTIIDNIRYGKIHAKNNEIVDAAKKAHADDFISKMPNGYFSNIGETSLQLSSGQKQRILIARAFLKNSPIILLDEPTSSLDPLTENLIQNTLYDLIKDKTAIVIAHHLSILYEMDRILVFKDGQIIEDGTHLELIKANGYYAYLFKIQSSKMNF